jgi:hypothetical protein
MGTTIQTHNYTCFTQVSSEPIWWRPPQTTGGSDPHSINVGLNAIIPRWDVSQKNTTLRYFVQADIFPSAQDAQDVAAAFQQAAEEWNNLGLGVVFTPAPRKENIHFKVVYQVNDADDPDEATRYAQAFFPNQSDQDVIVTDFALSTPERPILKNVFLHELGHVLGLRHEFAVLKEGYGAVRFMDDNPNSVMAYTAKPTMQITDIAGVKAFYQKSNGDMSLGTPIVDIQPQFRENP